MASRRRSERKLVPKSERKEFSSAIHRGRHHDWSPDEIAGRLRRDSPDDKSKWISASSIDRWIERNELRDLWRLHLRRRGKRSRTREKKANPEQQRIEGRDEIIERRSRVGDLEGDTVLGTPGTRGVINLVDRLSRLLIMTKIFVSHEIMSPASGFVP